jgi:hypothetical protein
MKLGNLLATGYLAFTAVAVVPFALAEEKPKLDQAIQPPKNALQLANKNISVFDKSFEVVPTFRGSVVDLNSDIKKEKDESQGFAVSQPSLESKGAEEADKKNKLRFVSENPESDPVLSPEQTPSVRLNPDAPSPFKGMVEAWRTGDRRVADLYADQFIRYQQNFLFEVREYTHLIGEALIRQSVIDEEDWVGVPQMIDYEFAKTRQEEKSLIKATHDVAMKRIKSDEKNQAEVYYFFTLSSGYSRGMAADVERLWRAVKKDKNVKMVALALGASHEDWIEEYRNHTGLTLPIYSGEKMAKTLNVGFVPALVVVAPNGKRAYLKSGQQTFSRMYEFVRTVQGLPVEKTPELEEINDTPIGKVEIDKFKKEQKEGKIKIGINSSANVSRISLQAKPRESVKMERF